MNKHDLPKKRSLQLHPHHQDADLRDEEEAEGCAGAEKHARRLECVRHSLFVLHHQGYGDADDAQNNHIVHTHTDEPIQQSVSAVKMVNIGVLTWSRLNQVS